MKFNTLKRNLPFVLLCSIVATSITIPSVAKAQKISTADITKANQIVLKVKNALKDLFNSANVKGIKNCVVYLRTTNPCGQASDETLQFMRSCWGQLIRILKKASNPSYARNHLGAALGKIVDQIEDFANQFENQPELKSLENILKSIPIETKKTFDAMGISGKIKVMLALKKTKW